jgi:hypothetical protein
VLPDGGGGGNATQNVVNPIEKSNINKNLVFISLMDNGRKYIKKHWNSNSLLKIMPNLYICCYKNTLWSKKRTTH